MTKQKQMKEPVSKSPQKRDENILTEDIETTAFRSVSERRVADGAEFESRIDLVVSAPLRVARFRSRASPPLSRARCVRRGRYGDHGFARHERGRTRRGPWFRVEQIAGVIFRRLREVSGKLAPAGAGGGVRTPNKCHDAFREP